jgi:ribonuclease D
MTDRRLAAAKNMAVRQRNYRRARDRALVQLAQLHPETYTQLLEREKANDEAQGRKWIDINGTTNSVDNGPAISYVADVRETSNGGEDEGHNGGEE